MLGYERVVPTRIYWYVWWDMYVRTHIWYVYCFISYQLFFLFAGYFYIGLGWEMKLGSVLLSGTCGRFQFVFLGRGFFWIVSLSIDPKWSASKFPFWQPGREIQWLIFGWFLVPANCHRCGNHYGNPWISSGTTTYWWIFHNYLCWWRRIWRVQYWRD